MPLTKLHVSKERSREEIDLLLDTSTRQWCDRSAYRLATGTKCFSSTRSPVFRPSTLA